MAQVGYATPPPPGKESQAKPKQSKFPDAPKRLLLSQLKKPEQKQKEVSTPACALACHVYLWKSMDRWVAAMGGGLQQRFCFLLECEWRILLGGLVLYNFQNTAAEIQSI